jgi:hypothetical protein
MSAVGPTPPALPRWIRVAGWAVAVLYVVAVGFLGASSFWSPNEQVFWPEIAAFVVTLPVSIAGVIPFYLGGALIWNIANAGSGGPMWPVTLVYGLMFAGLAAGDVWLLRRLARALRRQSYGATVLLAAVPPAN